MADWELLRLEVVDSTNRYAADAARTGAPEGLVVVADAQEAGRGRLGRRWVTPPSSSLLCSFLLRPALALELFPLVTVALALAAKAAIGRLSPAPVALKWPNDLLVGEHKLAGVLAEVVAATDAPGPALVIGIGVNLAWPQGFSPDAEEAALLSNATTLAEQGAAVPRDELLDALLEEFGTRYDRLLGRGGPEALLADYRRACVTIGQRVLVSEARREWEGLAEDVDDHGRLVVTVDGVRHLLDAADVVHLRAPESP